MLLTMIISYNKTYFKMQNRTEILIQEVNKLPDIDHLSLE